MLQHYCSDILLVVNHILILFYMNNTTVLLSQYICFTSAYNTYCSATQLNIIYISYFNNINILVIINMIYHMIQLYMKL